MSVEPRDRRLRHDGVDPDPDHAPGPVVKLDPATMKPYPRHDITGAERTAALEEAARLTWAEQGEQVRRLNSILLSRITNDIEDGRSEPEALAGALGRISDIAKKWSAETRANGDAGDDPTKLSDTELERRLR